MRRRFVTALLALALCGIVVGLKLDVVHRFGSDLPMWDQWDAEGITVFVPWAKGGLTLEHLIRPHNEHRVALTRLLGMAELAVNGQWDARLQCVVNAFLHAGLAIALWGFARRLLGASGSAVGFVLAAALIGLPISWQNVISGFHSQQYFLLLLSFSAIVLLPTSAPGTARWWLGGVAGLLALFSMASGLLAAVAVVAVALLQSWRGSRPLRSQGPSLVLCAALIAAGAALHVHYVGHDPLKARDLSEFFRYTLHSLEWPLESPWAAALLWAPLVGLAARLAQRATEDPRSDALVLFALGGWTLAQILASAYARGAGADYPASRYMDTLALGLAVNGLASAWLVQRCVRGWRFAAVALLVAWSATAGWGVYRLTRANYVNDLPATRDYYARCEANTRAYLATGDPSHLRGEDFPYPNANNFRERIDQPALRAIMPASVRPPLRLQTARGDEVLHEVAAGTEAARPSRHWSSRGGRAGTWESVVMDFPRSTTLLFRFDGALAGAAAPILQFRDTRLGAPVADVLAERTGHSPEFSATVALPAGTAQLVARIERPSGWLAFEEPVEVARFSAIAARFASLGRWLALVSGIAAVLLLAMERALARR
ncbi:MAG: hypothetical protein HZA32_18910 [Opitutae bacterium]|nr:hypothetical protein [Opitutae bacterium]